MKCQRVPSTGVGFDIVIFHLTVTVNLVVFFGKIFTGNQRFSHENQEAFLHIFPPIRGDDMTWPGGRHAARRPVKTVAKTPGRDLGKSSARSSGGVRHAGFDREMPTGFFIGM